MKNQLYVLIGFCVVTLTVGVLVGLGKIAPEWLGSPVSGFLGWASTLPPAPPAPPAPGPTVTLVQPPQLPAAPGGDAKSS